MIANLSVMVFSVVMMVAIVPVANAIAAKFVQPINVVWRIIVFQIVMENCAVMTDVEEYVEHVQVGSCVC